MGRLALDEAPDPQQIARLARRTLSGIERRKKFDKISFLDTEYHSSASITLNVYGHLLTTEDRSAEIMQGVLTGAGIG